MQAEFQTQRNDSRRPHHVTAPGGQTKLLVMDRSAAFPDTFALMATTANEKVAMRITGGCKGMTLDDKVAMLEYFGFAFAGFRGMVWSGGTRQTTRDGELDPMVTDVPGVIAADNPGCVALGSAPRTDIMRLKDDSRLVLDDYDTGLNSSMSAVLIVQNGADGASDWDGDVDAAYGLMKRLQQYGGFGAVGVIAWNGGPITEKEVMISARNGWPTIIVEGSGRIADEIAAKFAARDEALLEQLPKGHKLRTVSRYDAGSLRAALIEFGFLAAD